MTTYKLTYVAVGYRMEIAVRYGYAPSIGSLVWALTKGASDREGAFDWGQVTGDTWPGINDHLPHGLVVVRRTIASSSTSDVSLNCC